MPFYYLTLLYSLVSCAGDDVENSPEPNGLCEEPFNKYVLEDLKGLPQNEMTPLFYFIF